MKKVRSTPVVLFFLKDTVKKKKKKNTKCFVSSKSKGYSLENAKYHFLFIASYASYG